MVSCIVHSAIALIGFAGKKDYAGSPPGALWEGIMLNARRSRLAAAFVGVRMFAPDPRPWDMKAGRASA
jgi:hypothetical protein